MGEVRGGGSDPGFTTANPGTSCARICCSQTVLADAKSGSALKSSVGVGFSIGGSTSVEAKRRAGGRLDDCFGGSGAAAGGEDEIGRCGIGTMGGADVRCG